MTSRNLIVCALLLAAIAATLLDLVRGPGSLAEVRELKAGVADMQAVNAALRRQNSVLGAEIVALTSGLDAIEEQAREELGMIRRGETFYLVNDAPFRLAADRQPADRQAAGNDHQDTAVAQPLLQAAPRADAR